LSRPGAGCSRNGDVTGTSANSGGAWLSRIEPGWRRGAERGLVWSSLLESARLKPGTSAGGDLPRRTTGSGAKIGVPPIRRRWSSRRAFPFPEAPSPWSDVADGFLAPPCVLVCAAGLSLVKDLVRDRTSHPSGSRLEALREEGPGPWRHEAPQKVLELSRPCPYSWELAGCGLPRTGPSPPGSRPTRSSNPGQAWSGQVHSGFLVRPAPRLAPAPTSTLIQMPWQDRRPPGRASRSRRLARACGPVL
jgi:hypothetical protein